MKTLRVLFLILIFSVPTYGQGKPIGVYSPGFQIENSPFSFGPIGDMVPVSQIDEAYQKSVSTGFHWILQIGYSDDPRISARIIAERNMIKFAKLMPYIVAVVYSEEWYEKLRGGAFERFGLTADHPLGIEIIYTWIGIQHKMIREVMHKPVIWVTTAVYWLQPVPPNTDYVAIEAYARNGESLWWAETRLLYAEVATDLPLIVIPRWFRNTGGRQGEDWESYSDEPTRESVDLYFRIFERDRYVAMLGFLLNSRPALGTVGLKDMPSLYSYVLSKIAESRR